MIALIGLIVCAIGFSGFAAWYFWPTGLYEPKAQNPEPVRPEPKPVSEPTPTSEPSGVYKYIVDGLTKAREELLSIKKENLSCNALSQWQERADTTTRLAHANNVQIHNPISQQLSACRNITDVELLNAIRMSIVNLLDRGIQAAKAGGR